MRICILCLKRFVLHSILKKGWFNVEQIIHIFGFYFIFFAIVWNGYCNKIASRHSFRLHVKDKLLTFWIWGVFVRVAWSSRSTSRTTIDVHGVLKVQHGILRRHWWEWYPSFWWSAGPGAMNCNKIYSLLDKRSVVSRKRYIQDV